VRKEEDPAQGAESSSKTYGWRGAFFQPIRPRLSFSSGKIAPSCTSHARQRKYSGFVIFSLTAAGLAVKL
jgi:hypothetical protein